MNAYQESLARLFAAGSVPKLGLERMQRVLAYLKNPEKKFVVLHVAGTNGKGSVSAYLDSMLGAAGVRRGLYTSPHLLSARERIVVDGELISPDEFVNFESAVDHAVRALGESLTFFERMTAMALLGFCERRVDVAVLEVGLGGRLDATNVVSPLVCGITRIDLDHTQMLGETIAKIAGEKAGIIKPRIPVVSDEQLPEARAVIHERCASLGAELWVRRSELSHNVNSEGVEVYLGDRCILPRTALPLRGEHQVHNLCVAMGMIERSGLVPLMKHRQEGIKSTQWMGRYETMQEAPLVLLDGAHNAAGMSSLLKTLMQDTRVGQRPIALVTGMTTGHGHDEMAQVWRRFNRMPSKVWATQSRAPRSLSAGEVEGIYRVNGFEHVFKQGQLSQAIEDALAFAASIQGVVVVAGSLYLAGEARSRWREMPKDDLLPLY